MLHSEGKLTALVVRLGVAAVLWVGVMLLNVSVYAGRLGGNAPRFRPYLTSLIVAVVAAGLIYSLRPIFQLAGGGLLKRVIGMEALPSLAIIAAFWYGAAQSFRAGNHLYLDVACGIATFLLAGQWMVRDVEWPVGTSGSEMEAKVARAARVIVPVVIVIALGIGILTGDVLRGVSVLVIGYPWALTIATPLAFKNAVDYALRREVVINDARVLETIGTLNAAVVNKTGTITEGRFELVEAPLEDLPMIAAVERSSAHPLGRAVMARFQESGQKLPLATAIETHDGLGISGLVGVGRLFVGNLKLFEGSDVKPPEDDDAGGRTVVHYGWDRVVAGRLLFNDSIRKGARELIEKLNELGVRTIVVSGDAAAATSWASGEVRAKEFRAEVPAGGNAAIVGELKKDGAVAMIGDWRDDAGAIAVADVGIALGSGDGGKKSASVVVTNGEVGRVIELVELAARTMRVVRTSLLWVSGVMAAGLATAVAGFAHPVLASFAMALLVARVTMAARSLDRVV